MCIRDSALDAADEDVDGRGRVLCLHVGSDDLCAIGCVDWVAGHAEEISLSSSLSSGHSFVENRLRRRRDGRRRRRKALQASVLLSVSISNLESRCPTRRFRLSRNDVFRTKRDKGVGRLRKFTAFCIENGISLACSLSLSHPSSKSQTPKAKRNLRHLRSHAYPLETHTERRED